jgi:hypothetical protein
MPKRSRRTTRPGQNEREGRGVTSHASKRCLTEEMLADWPLGRRDTPEGPEPAAPLYSPAPTVADGADDDRARHKQRDPAGDSAHLD